jgi:two-component system, OmpR family, sensor histidine kinase QseC
MTSIKSFLISTILGIVIFAIIIISYISYTETQHEIEELFDAELAQTSKIFLRFIDFKIDQHPSPDMNTLSNEQLSYLSDKLLANTNEDMPRHEYEGKIAFIIYDSGYNILLESENAPKYYPKKLQQGFLRKNIDDQKWHLFILKDKKSKLWLVTAQHDEIRQELSEEILIGLLDTSLIGTPILILLIWFLLGKGLKPLEVIAQKISKRDPKHLELLQMDQVPDEIQPIIESLNQLFERLSKALEREKRFTADASHELRTPLSILKIHAQNAQVAKNKKESEQSLDLLLQGVDKSTHLVEQLLKLARLEPEQTTKIKFKLINISALLKKEYALKIPLALNKHQDINIDLPKEEVFCAVNELAVSLMMSNLLENAINYCPQNGKIDVNLTIDNLTTGNLTTGNLTTGNLNTEKINTQFSLSIENTGDIILKENKERLFERFYRINPGKSKGSGLGLSIVKQCVDIHHAEITLPETESGLHIVIKFNCP